MKFKILLVLVLAMFMVSGFTWADDDDDGHRCGCNEYCMDSY